MKRYLAIVFCVLMSILALFGGGKMSIEEVCGSAGVGYEVVDKNIVKIDSKDVDVFLEYLGAKIISKFDVSDRSIIEGYSSKLGGYKYIDGFRINIQISILDDYALIGSPLINGSF